jgi:hypothetical protein
MTVLRAMRTLLKRWWFWAVAVLVAAGIGVGALFVYAGQTKLTQANFDRIQIGMTEQEVHDILGENNSFFSEDKGWFAGGKLVFSRARVHYPPTGLAPGEGAGFWKDGPTAIRVDYGSDHRVMNKHFYPATAGEKVKDALRKCLPKSVTESWEF